MAVALERAFAAFDGLSRGERRLVLGFLSAGGLLRLLVVPARLVMIYMGYRLASEVYMFTSVPKYGPGTFVLYRAAFAVFGPSHETLVMVNAVCGVLGLPLLAGLLARFKPPPGSVAAAAAFLALTPLLVHDHRTESILVPTALFTFAGLLLWDGWLTGRSRLDLAGAVVLLVLAAMSRPEMIAMAPLLAGVLAVARHEPGLWRGRLPALALALVAALALLAPSALHVLRATSEQLGGGALPSLQTDLFTRLTDFLTVPIAKNVLLDPRLYPAALTALVAVGLLASRGPVRRLAIGLAVASFIWIAFYSVDLPWTSIPRLEAPLAALMALVGGVGWGLVTTRERLGRFTLPRPAVRVAVLTGALVLTAVPTGFALWAPTNEDEEDRFIAEAVAALPDERVCFLRIDSPDEPKPRKVHRYFPDYLLRPPHRSDRVYGLSHWLRDPPDEERCPGGTYFIQSLRCYAVYIDFPHETKAARHEPPFIAGCRKLKEATRLTAVLEKRVPNHGDNEFGYYPEIPEFELGLYRVDGLAKKR